MGGEVREGVWEGEVREGKVREGVWEGVRTSGPCNAPGRVMCDQPCVGYTALSPSRGQGHRGWGDIGSAKSRTTVAPV